MKHIILFFAVIMAVACTNNEKVLVAYFSATGTTEAVAQRISEADNAELFKIEPSVPYTEADLNWRDSSSRSSVEMKALSSRPATARKIENPESYSKVYVGFPIWWYTAPTIINTFFEENDLAGKTVILFATSGGSDITKACEDLRKAYPELDIRSGKLLNNAADADIAAFVKGL